ncbi:MAG: M48 family metallopeptidase [Gammaproteobacteria bacterium]|nr:M48 family metallopeptidase [Gammaproteobacteria bacterium]MDH3407089.1 M48 family metallopeptidase [Gammaproteobacteria bacterium]MDH5486852.1 M48 family metallopeptidase [Gammaproteobacteria bacterium]
MNFRVPILFLLIVSLLASAVHAAKLDLDKLKDVKEKLKVLKEPSEADEIEIGKGVAANLLGAAPPVNDTKLQAYVNRVGKWIAMHSDRPDLPWHFAVLDTDGVNAFAVPGGYIFITRGMLLRMRDEAELAGVLAHEVTHVVEKHALNTMRKGNITGLASDALGKYAEKKGMDEFTKIVSAGTEIYARGLDKEDEFAADRAGVVIAARAGYDPYGLPSVLQTLASINPKDDAVTLMFKTHPDSGKRLELVSSSMEGRLDEYIDSPRVESRFFSIIKSHLSSYKPTLIK